MEGARERAGGAGPLARLAPAGGELGSESAVKTLVIECQSCGGTGLYIGRAEKGKCAVVCYVCKGTGKVEFYYKKFTGRKKRDDVERVFKSSYGYVHTHKNITDSSGKLIRFEEGGCTYDEWLNGAEPKPVKDLYCPYQWDNRGMGNEPCSRCKEGVPPFGWLAKCKFHNDKDRCWEEYERSDANG